MKLEALDQISVSSVKSDSLRPGEQFTVSDAFGEELVSKHPDKFRKIDDSQPEPSSPIDPVSKAEPAPSNKAEIAPANKADHRKKHGKGE